MTTLYTMYNVNDVRHMTPQREVQHPVSQLTDRETIEVSGGDSGRLPAVSTGRCPCGNRLINGRKEFCSGLCRRKFGKPKSPSRISATCEICDREFMALRSSARRFCSYRCSGEWTRRSGRLRGPNSPHWKGGVAADTVKYRKRYADRFPEKALARRLVNDAIRRGELQRQPCEKCGADKTHGHHDDYSKPLDVRWLCRKHHAEHHRTMGDYDSTPYPRRAP